MVANNKLLSFQDIIKTLNQFWSDKGCIVLHSYDKEVGAGTLSPFTALRTLGRENWNCCYVQASRRPTDGRYGENPNRLGHYFQYQIIMKPSPSNIIDLYLESIAQIGINPKHHDIRFVEDDWENPTIGAAGLGWEVWCDGMEITQFTYMQQIGSVACKQIPAEITIGLERIAMYVQNKKHVMDIIWNNDGVKYGDIFFEQEKQFSAYNFEYANTSNLLKKFVEVEEECSFLIEKNLPLVAYEKCLEASHILNLLESRGVIAVTERAYYIARVRNLAKLCCGSYIAMDEMNNSGNNKKQFSSNI